MLPVVPAAIAAGQLIRMAGTRGIAFLASRISAPATPAGLLNFAKENPTTFFLAAKETFDIASGLVSSDVGEQAMSLISQYIDYDESGAETLTFSASELYELDRVIRRLGGMTALVELRNALTMPASSLAAYSRIQELSL